MLKIKMVYNIVVWIYNEDINALRTAAPMLCLSVNGFFSYFKIMINHIINGGFSILSELTSIIFNMELIHLGSAGVL